MSTSVVGVEGRGGYDPSFYEPLFLAEDRHFWFRTRNRVIASLVRQVVAAFRPGYRVLEVGCGDGNVLRVLEQACSQGTVIGMDLFRDGLYFARRRVTCPILQADIRHAPFKQGVHLIGLYDVLEHVPDDLNILRILHDMLLPGGALMLTVPAHMSLWSYVDVAGPHLRRYERQELESKLLQAGFRIEFVSEYMMCLFPLLWIKRRWLQRGRSFTPEQAEQLGKGELAIQPILNQLLIFLLTAESWVIAKRGCLPIGTSLLAIARRRA